MSCTTPLLSVARRLIERGGGGDPAAALVVPAWPATVREHVARALLAASQGAKSRKYVMQTTPRNNDRRQWTSTTPFGLARAHNGLPAFRLSGSSSQRLPASRGFTNHSTITTAAGSLASIYRPDRAGRGSTTSCCCARACQADSKLCPCNMQCNMPLAGIYHVSNQHCSQSASLSHLRCSRSELFSPLCIGEIIA